MATLHVLRVFTDEAGAWGNPLGVFLDGAEVPAERRQEVAADLGFSETVFVDDLDSGACRIFTPGSELGFAGHPSVGTAWLLAREEVAIETLRPPAGDVAVRFDGELTFIVARPEWSPPWHVVQMDDPAAIDALDGPPPGLDEVYCWAWEDEAAGVVRSRCFAIEDGVGEDEATGSAAIVLSAELDRELTIHQGAGSLLWARPVGDGTAEVGGRCALDEVREY
ncbi:MAG TPA: PhzF family phenazine biosynthesis protein [Solirubrobacterales bacterium]|nr:PhzF family phenazine biosynthesis protein [Solirubrobacterales bacterium]